MGRSWPVPASRSRTFAPGGRAYACSGLPGAEWWVAGPVTARPEDADVELDDVVALYTEYELWASVLGE